MKDTDSARLRSCVSKMKKAVTVLLVCLFLCVTANCIDDKVTVYKQVDNDENKIALTFDDGPHPKYTPEIIELLDKYDIKATFFIVGKNAKENPDILRQIVDAGHEIGNHTVSHIDFNKSSYDKIKKEILECNETILEIGEYSTKLLRPPGGAVNKKVRQIAKSEGFKIILWSVDTRDWAHISVEKMTDNIMTNVKSGSIILFHDYISRKSPTPETLDIVIPMLLEKGYKFVTVGEMIE